MAASLLFLLYFLWTVSFPLGKLAVSLADPIFFTGIRMGGAGLILLLYAMMTRRPFPTDRKSLIGIFLIALGPIYLTNILEFWSLSRIESGKVCFIYSLCPFLTSFLSFLHFKEKLTPKKCLGMGIGFLGILPAFFQGPGPSFSDLFTVRGPELSIIIASISSVYGLVLMRKLVRSQISISVINGTTMAVGSLLCFLHSAVTYHGISPVLPGKMAEVLSLAGILILLSNVVCYNLYGYLLKRFTATLVSFAGLLSPFFAALHGYFLLGEKPSWLLLSSMLFIGTGLWMVYQEELRQGYILRRDDGKPVQTIDK